MNAVKGLKLTPPRRISIRRLDNEPANRLGRDPERTVDPAFKNIEGIRFFIAEGLRVGRESHAEPLLDSPGLVPTLVVPVPENKENNPNDQDRRNEVIVASSHGRGRDGNGSLDITASDRKMSR